MAESEVRKISLIHSYGGVWYGSVSKETDALPFPNTLSNCSSFIKDSQNKIAVCKYVSLSLTWEFTHVLFRRISWSVEIVSN